MSAYIVDNKTINRILSYLHLERDNQWIKRQIKEETGFDVDSENDLDQLGRAMLLLNIDAVNQRYEEENNSTKLLEKYHYSLELTNNIQALKSLICWDYQCSEGDITERSLYKLMEKVKTSWLEHIVCNLPVYDKAEWA